MTGFYEKKFIAENYSLLISIKTLNHRYFDWYFKGNSYLAEIENRFRKLARKEFKRGRVEVMMDLEFLPSFNWEIYVNNNLLEKIFNSLKPIFKKFKNKITFPLDSIIRIPGVFTIKPLDLRKEIEFLEKCFMEVLKGVKKQREREGKFIKKEILISLEKIKFSLKEVEKLAVNQPQQIEEKLKEKINKLKFNEILEERLAQEIFFYIQKIDIKEEIDRLQAHLEQLNNLINSSSQEPIGRKIEFLLQEIHREINTINSKSQNLDIISHAIEIKSEIEKIRQQIQNIE
jgi:uncharacterized protein (TIGR00255 family)